MDKNNQILKNFTEKIKEETKRLNEVQKRAKEESDNTKADILKGVEFGLKYSTFYLAKVLKETSKCEQCSGTGVIICPKTGQDHICPKCKKS